MPVTGFPSRLENILNLLLQEACVSSFKIEGKQNQTTVVLRFSSSCQPPATQTHGDTVTYRKKCPSQIARDRTRAEAHGSAKASSTSPPSALFLPTPPSLYYSKPNVTAQETFHSDSPMSSTCCVAGCARETRLANQSLTMPTVSNTDQQLVAQQSADLTHTLEDGTVFDTKQTDSEDFSSLHCGQSTILFETSTTEDKTGERRTGGEGGVGSAGASDSDTGQSLETFQQIMDCIENNSKTMDRILEISKPEEVNNSNTAGKCENSFEFT